MALVTGDRELIAKLQKMKKVTTKKAIRKGSRAGAKLIAAAAKASAPRLTGALASSIKVRALPRSRRWTGTQVTIKVADGSVFYSSFVELGTKKMKARHFLKHATAATKGSAGAAFVAGIKGVIDNESGR